MQKTHDTRVCYIMSTSISIQAPQKRQKAHMTKKTKNMQCLSQVDLFLAKACSSFFPCFPDLSAMLPMVCPKKNPQLVKKIRNPQQPYEIVSPTNCHSKFLSNNQKNNQKNTKKIRQQAISQGFLQASLPHACKQIKHSLWSLAKSKASFTSAMTCELFWLPNCLRCPRGAGGGE